MLLNDKELYDRVSRNARNFALQHDWTHISQKYKKVFDEFLPEAKVLKDGQKTIETKVVREVKVCNDYLVLAEEIDEFLTERKITPTTKTIMNMLQMKGYMQ